MFVDWGGFLQGGDSLEEKRSSVVGRGGLL